MLNRRGRRPTTQGAMSAHLSQPGSRSPTFLVEHCDIPAELTLAEWRRRCAEDRRAARQAERAGHGRVRRGLRRALQLG